jgi:hypothetical protein
MTARDFPIQAVILLIVRYLFPSLLLLISFLSYVVLTDDEVFRLVSCMFDKSLVSTRPVIVPEPYCSGNPPPTVGDIIFSDLLFIYY